MLDRCVQLHGGYGYMTEYPIARAWADARATRIYGGTNEIMREIVGRSAGARGPRQEDRMSYDGRWQTIRVAVDDGIAWVELHRPEKRNAMNPLLNSEMLEVLEALDADDGAGVLVLTGAGESFSAGMDLKEYFREVDDAPAPRAAQGAPRQRRLADGGCCAPTRSRRSRWSTAGASAARSSRSSPATSPIAADEATFGVSEINWGIPPGERRQPRARRDDRARATRCCTS